MFSWGGGKYKLLEAREVEAKYDDLSYSIVLHLLENITLLTLCMCLIYHSKNLVLVKSKVLRYRPNSNPRFQFSNLP